MVTFESRKAAVPPGIGEADGGRTRTLREIARLSPGEREPFLRARPASVDADETAAWDALADDGLH